MGSCYVTWGNGVSMIHRRSWLGHLGLVGLEISFFKKAGLHYRRKVMQVCGGGAPGKKDGSGSRKYGSSISLGLKVIKIENIGGLESGNRQPLVQNRQEYTSGGGSSETFG